MGYQSHPCYLNEASCTARASSKHRGITVRCRVCAESVCLSCSVLTPRGITCHKCALCMGPVEARQVKAHRGAMSAGGSLKAPRARLDAVSSALAPTPPSVARRRAQRAAPPRPPAQPAPVDTAGPSRPSSLWASPAPAVPSEYPAERRKDLGYAR